MNGSKRPIFATLAALAVAVLAAQVQSASAQKRPLVKTDSVTFLFPEQVTVTVGKPSQVELHFRVAPGLHINSHAPTDEFLIPTVFSIPEGPSVRLESATYPAGIVIALPVDPTTKLSVYTGEFIIEARIVATAGNHRVQGQLHYQACDNNECLPPKTMNVAMDVIGK
jgi:hypothetical protein